MTEPADARADSCTVTRVCSPRSQRPAQDPDDVRRPMELPAKEALLDAAGRARLLYPGPVGELLHQELVSWLQFGHLLGSALIFRVVDELNQAPDPASPASPTRSDGAPVVSTVGPVAQATWTRAGDGGAANANSGAGPRTSWRCHTVDASSAARKASSVRPRGFDAHRTPGGGTGSP
jgi:hypothetical protein